MSLYIPIGDNSSIVGILRLFLGVVSKTIQQLFVLGFGSVTDMLTRVNYFFFENVVTTGDQYMNLTSTGPRY